MSNRRTFIKVAATALAGAAALSRHVYAQAGRLEESDPAAAALGYKRDASKVDKAKFPKYAPGQICANCILFQGKAADPSAPCAAFAGKSVEGKGWCSAWNRKAA